MFKDKILMITGGTGSFGKTVLKRFLNTDVKEIRIFSRDEKVKIRYINFSHCSRFLTTNNNIRNNTTQINGSFFFGEPYCFLGSLKCLYIS